MKRLLGIILLFVLLLFGCNNGGGGYIPEITDANPTGDPVVERTIIDFKDKVLFYYDTVGEQYIFFMVKENGKFVNMIFDSITNIPIIGNSGNFIIINDAGDLNATFNVTKQSFDLFLWTDAILEENETITYVMNGDNIEATLSSINGTFTEYFDLSYIYGSWYSSDASSNTEYQTTYWPYMIDGELFDMKGALSLNEWAESSDGITPSYKDNSTILIIPSNEAGADYQVNFNIVRRYDFNNDVWEDVSTAWIDFYVYIDDNELLYKIDDPDSSGNPLYKGENPNVEL